MLIASDKGDHRSEDAKDMVKLTGTYYETRVYDFETCVSRTWIGYWNEIPRLKLGFDSVIAQKISERIIKPDHLEIHDFEIGRDYQLDAPRKSVEENSGREPIGDCFFVWMKDKHELYGHVERPWGEVVKGSAGFWRTASVFNAKMMAKEIFVDPFEVEPEEEQ